MEKFSKFRDGATGVAPFLPVKHTQAPSALSKLVLVPLAILSWSLLIVYFIAHVLLLQYIPFVSAWHLQLILKTLRLLYINFSYEGEKRVSARRCQQYRAKAGDVIVSNFVSPLDAIVYAARQPTTFVFPTTDGQFATAGVLCAAYQALSSQPFGTKGRDISSIALKAKSQGSVIVLFVEGTASNGRGVLTLKDVNVSQFNEAKAPLNIFPAAVRYTPGTAASPLPQTSLGYLWRVLNESWWYMCSVRIGSEPLRSETITHESMTRAICNIGRLRQLGDELDLEAKQEFLKAYKEKRK